MTAIRVKSPPSEDETEQLLRQHTNSSNGSFQLEGVVSDTWTRSSRSKAEVGGRSESYPEHHRRNSLSELDRRERAASRISMPASLRSEPDLDTIMPLSGAEGGLTRTAALSGYEGEGQGEDEQDEDTPSFTTVEVSRCEDLLWAIELLSNYIHTTLAVHCCWGIDRLSWEPCQLSCNFVVFSSIGNDCRNG